MIHSFFILSHNLQSEDVVFVKVVFSIVCLDTTFFFNFNFYFILLYNTVLVLPYIDMNPPQVYMCFQS